MKSDGVKQESPIPEGAIWKKQTIRRDTPVNGFAAIAPWAQAATLKVNQSLADTAVIEIDYWSIYEIVNGSEKLVYTEGYDYSYIKTFSTNEAGLYCRMPSWFDTSCHDQHSIASNMAAYMGTLVIDVAKTPNNIVHWWTPKLVCVPNANYLIEARVKITGKTALQFGLDYWRTLTADFTVFDPDCILSNNCEAWISDWILPTQGEFITVRVPVR
jgi:hypothetical protein